MPYPDNLAAQTLYPPPAAVRARQQIAALAFAAHTDNERVRKALEAAIGVVERCDPASYCMAPGYDWTDIIAGLRDMMPQTEDRKQVDALDEWARDRVGDVVS